MSLTCQLLGCRKPSSLFHPCTRLRALNKPSAIECSNMSKIDAKSLSVSGIATLKTWIFFKDLRVYAKSRLLAGAKHRTGSLAPYLPTISGDVEWWMDSLCSPQQHPRRSQDFRAPLQSVKNLTHSASCTTRRTSRSSRNLHQRDLALRKSRLRIPRDILNRQSRMMGVYAYTQWVFVEGGGGR